MRKTFEINKILFGILLVALGVYYVLPIKIFPYMSNLPQDKEIVKKDNSLLNPTRSSHYIDETLLKHKIKLGLPNWAKEQIKEDLEKFNKIEKVDLAKYHEKYNALFRFQIEDGKLKSIYQDNLDIIPAYKVMYDMFSFLAKKGYIPPNTDFLLAMGDYFKPSEKAKIPIFVFAKDLDDPYEKDHVLLPDWMNLRDTYYIRSEISKAKQTNPWSSKLPVLFWRGSEACSTGFRNKLVALSKQHPELIDAKFVDKQAVKYVAPGEHLKYKYLISIDGIRCTWVRLVWHLHSNSLTFKHQSNQVQWFYKGLKPFEHYIPVKDENDLIQSLNWAEKHSEEVQSIISRSSTFVEDNLTLEDMYHYFIVLIEEYNKKLERT